MRKLIRKLWNKALDFFKWVWSECKDWRTLVLLGIVCLVLGLPVWGGYLVGFLFHWEWAFWVATVAWAFWMLPGAPYFALCVSITLVIKRLFERAAGKKKSKPRFRRLCPRARRRKYPLNPKRMKIPRNNSMQNPPPVAAEGSFCQKMSYAPLQKSPNVV